MRGFVVRKMTRAVLLLMLLATPALGQTPGPRPLEGRYALHAEACKANDTFLTFRGDRMDLPVFSCTGLKFVPRKAGPGDGALWDVVARHCAGEESKPGPQKFALESRGTSLRIFWPNGEKSAPLKRCGR